MSRSFGLVEYKVQEAEYFLDELTAKGQTFDLGPIQFLASAFTSATRSVTFAMQASLKGVTEFDRWYEQKQLDLKANALARFFHEFRTVTQHLGINVVRAGESSGNVKTYYFIGCRDLPNVPREDVVTACQAYFRLILDVVYDCYIAFATRVDGQWYFTEDNFRQLGRTVEDAEEELGLPRGWTDLGKPELLPHRWDALRRHADGCMIEEQFARWLGKQVPQPQQA
ncbi:MAG: hypothetical protein ACRCV9_18775 [Burkholderiaceae bacterium]